MTPATFLSLPLAIGIAWAGGNMAARMQVGTAAVAEVDPCAMRFQMADREAMLVIDVPCRIVPVIKADTEISRRHPVKLFYDRVPEEMPMVPVAVRPEFPAQVAEIEEIPVQAEPRRTSRGCKPGRTRNEHGKCGVWR